MQHSHSASHCTDVPYRCVCLPYAAARFRCPPKGLNDLYYVLATLLTILVLLVVIYLEQKTMTETIRRSECTQHAAHARPLWSMSMSMLLS